MYNPQPHITPHTFSALNLSIDEDGFLLSPDQWTSQIAQQLADAADIGPLSEKQWEVIFFLRKKYFSLGAIPPMRSLCKKLDIDRDAVKTEFGSCRNLWQISGLPNPGEEAKSYMDNWSNEH